MVVVVVVVVVVCVCVCVCVCVGGGGVISTCQENKQSWNMIIKKNKKTTIKSIGDKTSSWNAF